MEMDFDLKSIEELWAFHEEIASIVAAKIQAESSRSARRRLLRSTRSRRQRAIYVRTRVEPARGTALLCEARLNAELLT
jgi:hypothetical protein